ncbi:hypothetical protein AGMMS50262_17270 [Bacteroidia bacterium]|nr:hypothetical protein AGMMS50262_17270 [Bacteroidia bacterium]
MKTCFLEKSIVAVFLLLTVGTLSAQQTKFSEPKLSDPASWTMVFNAQALGGGWSGNGGDGWLRILEFLPDGKTVKVKTFSPLFAASPTTQQFAWRTKPYDEFTFTLE